MPVSNSHLTGLTQVWDGFTFAYVPRERAEELEAAGTHQISTNLSASDLKRFHELNEHATKIRRARIDPPTENASPKQSTRRRYKTRQMKADD